VGGLAGDGGAVETREHGTDGRFDQPGEGCPIRAGPETANAAARPGDAPQRAALRDIAGMNKPPIKSEPPLNLSIAERETLIARHQAASTDTRLSPLSQARASKVVQQLRWIQHQRIQRLCAALGANCETPAVHRADGPASEHELAIDGAWDILISATAKKLGWEGEPTSRAMGLNAFHMPHGADRAEMYRKAGLIKALEDHRPSPMGDGETKALEPASVAQVPADDYQAAVDKAWDGAIAAAAKNLGWDGAPTSRAMFAAALLTPKGAAKTELYRSANLIKALEDQRIIQRTDGKSAGDHWAAIDKVWEGVIAAHAKSLGWEGEPTSGAMFIKAFVTPLYSAERAKLIHSAGLIKALEVQRAILTPFRPARKELKGTVTNASTDLIPGGDGATGDRLHLTLDTGEMFSAFKHELDDSGFNITSREQQLQQAGLTLNLATLTVPASPPPAAPASVSSPAPTVPTPAVQGLPVDLFVSNRTATPAPAPAHDAPPHQTNKPGTILMKKTWQWPTVRTAVIIAVMLAVVSFFLMSDYSVRWSLIVNVMRGHSFADIPYRWILAALAVFVGVVALKQRKP
jgi:hypothetical protein